MTTKILEYNFPLDIKQIQEDIDKYVSDGYIISNDIFIPEHETENRTHLAQLLITLVKYEVTIFSGPYTFNIVGDI